MTESTKPVRVLILCTGNSARSQLAEGLLRHDGGELVEVESAGTHPWIVSPWAIEAMEEIDIDISGHRSKSIDEFVGESFDFLITVCDSAKESCPAMPGVKDTIHWSIDDPSFLPEAERLDGFRRARDELRERLRGFVEERVR